MESSLHPANQLLHVNHNLFLKAASDLTPEQWFEAPEGTNPLIWLAGHLVHARHGLVQTAGASTDRPWQEIFGRYSKILPPESYPPPAEILESWNRATDLLKSRLKQLTEEELQLEVPTHVPLKVKTRLAVITFLAWHESYHIGQMAYVRKYLGLGGLIDG